MLLPQRIAEQCAQRPDATAVLHVTGGVCGTTLSYGQLQQQAHVLAAALLDRGNRAVATGGVVAVLLDEAPGSVVAELAAMYAGAAFAPLDPGAPAARLCYQLADCEAFALIHSRAQSALVQGLLKHGADAGGVHVVEFEAAIEAAARNLPAGVDVPFKAVAAATVQPSDACHVIYTSGSTGKPKGVVCEHGALRHYADAKLQSHGIDDQARVLLVSAATWDPSVGDAFSTLACGATLVTAPRARLVQDLAAVLREGAVSHVCSTPALWGMLPATVSWDCFPALRVIALGGERLPSALIKQWQPREPACAGEQCRLLNTYGVTEATVYQTVGECRFGDRPGMVGRPLPGVVCAVAAPPGEPGEIWISGPLLARGYLRAADLTAQKFVTVADNAREAGKCSDSLQWLTPGRWFRTGDLGRWHGAAAAVVDVPTGGMPGSDAGGPMLELMGRIDSQIKLRGFRIELGEVESVLTDHDLVDAAAVVLYTGAGSAQPSRTSAAKPREPEPPIEPESEPRLVAYVTMSEGVADDAWESGGAEVAVRVHCRRQLSAHAIPTQFVRLDRLPLTASGKVDRLALPDPPLLRTRSSVAKFSTRAMTSMEGVVADAWAAALSIPVAEIRLEDNFFQLGGSSVKAVVMVQQLEIAHRQGRQASSDQGDWSHQDPRVRYCALFRKPRLVDYAAFLEWVAVAAPTRSANDHRAFVSKLVPAASSNDSNNSSGSLRSDPLDAEELLSLMDQVLPGADDEVTLLNAALKSAAAGGHDLVVSALLQANAHPDAGYTKKDRGDTPLILAAGAGHKGAVCSLISAGASPNLPDTSARTAAHLLAGAGNAELLRWMLTEGGASAEVKDVNKWSLSHFAAWHGRTEVLGMLLRLKAAQSLALAHERVQRTCGKLSEVALQQQLDVLRHDEHALLAHAQHLLPTCFGGDRSAVPIKVLTEAALAAEMSLGSILEWAAGRIQSGVRRDWSFVIDARDRWNRTSLSWALFRGHADAAQVLIDGGAKFDWRNPYPAKKLKRNNNRWNTSLHLVVQAAIADDNATPAGPTCADGGTDETPLVSSEESDQMQNNPEIQYTQSVDAKSNRFAVLQLLLQHPEVLTNVDTPDNDGRTALHEAASLVFAKDIATIATCASSSPVTAGNGPALSAVTNPENARTHQTQALMVHAGCAVRLLLAAQAAVDATDHTGRTPLHYAVYAGQTAAVSLLLDAGADATAVTLPNELPQGSANSVHGQPSFEMGRRARRDVDVMGSSAVATQGAASEVSEGSRERHARRVRLHELEPRLRKVLEIYAAHEPLVASVLGARFEKVWGEPLKTKDYGYNKLSTLLRALPHLCEVRATQSENSASAPTLLVKLAGSSSATEAEEAERAELPAPQDEAWPGQTMFRRQAADLVRAARLS